MMRFYIFIIITILINCSIAEQKPIENFGKVEIEDLFIKDETNKNSAKKEIINETQLDKILKDNEDLDLESLEIADIDLATFGEYENFLNKYYDENFNDFNNKISKQIELITGSAFATKLPFGQNAQANMQNGFKIGLTFNDIYSFNIMNKNTDFNFGLSFSSNKHNIYNDKSWNFMHLESNLEIDIYKNFKSELGLGLISAEFNTSDTREQSAGFSLFLGLNYNYVIWEKFKITFYSRAVYEKTFDTIPMYIKGNSVEQLHFGISTSMPLFITY